MRSATVIAVSIIIGGLLGFGLSYVFMQTQISSMKSSMDSLKEDLEGKIVSLENNVQKINMALQENSKAISAQQSVISNIQNNLLQLESKITHLKTALSEDIASLQSQVSELRRGWVYVGTWESTEDFYTEENFKVKSRILIGWYLEGESWESYAYIRIYTVKGEFCDAIGVSGWLSTGYMEVPIEEPGYYYLDVDLNKANKFFVDVWTDETEGTAA